MKSQNDNGITLVALIVTIIVLLILAGISLNLIAGSNGIMERATKAADTYDYAKLEESLELSNAEMLLDCLGGGNLQTDLYDYIVKRCEENSDKTAQTSNGKYWIDSDGRLCYTDSDTNGTVKLRKDSNGNPKIIDPNAPITTYRVQYDANGGTGGPTDTSEYEEGDTVNVNFGTTPTREKYTFLGWARSVSATTPDYSSTGSFTMGTQNVTLYAVWTGISGTGTSIMKGAWYGDTVNYSANGCTDWKVFSNDGYIYLIAGDVVEGSTLNISGTIQMNGNYVYTTDQKNTTLLSWFTTTSNWSNFVNSMYAEQTTGGPTLEQLATSANAKLGKNYTADSIQLQTLNDALYKASTYWMLPSINSCNSTAIHMWTVETDGNVTKTRVSQDYGGAVRPLVRLKSDVKMTWNGSSWDLSN